VGTALASQLLRAPRVLRGRLLVWSRSASSRRALTGALLREGLDVERRVRVLSSPEQALVGTDVVLLCVADPALATLAGTLARASHGARRPVVLHTSGYMGLDCLRPLRRRGFRVGRMHPLHPFPTESPVQDLRGTFHALEGEPAAVRAAERLVASFAGHTFRLGDGAHAARDYHAGASLVGAGVLALQHLALETMEPCVRPSSRPVLREALAEFIRQNASNAARSGPRQALTGALSRGAEELVRGHVRALARVPHAREAYAVLGEVALELARERGSLDAAAHQRLRALLRRKR